MSFQGQRVSASETSPLHPLSNPHSSNFLPILALARLTMNLITHTPERLSSLALLVVLLEQTIVPQLPPCVMLKQNLPSSIMGPPCF